jgi:hypothetical protein
MSKFGKLNLEALQEEDNRVNSDAQTSFLDNFVPMPRPNPGSTGVVVVRIMPPAEGQSLFQYTRIHTINERKVHDPKRLVNGKWDKTPNPIFDYYNALWREADKSKSAGNTSEEDRLKAEARGIKPVERYYYNAIVRKMTDQEGNVQVNVGPRILSVGKTLHKMIVRAIIGDETDAPLGDVSDPENGFDFTIKVEMKGTGANCWPDYNRSSFSRDASPLGTPEEIQKWAANMHNLQELYRPADLETLEKELAIHRGLIADTNESGWNQAAFDAKFYKEPAASAATGAVATETAAAVQTMEESTEELEEDFLAKMNEISDTV